MIFSGHNDKYKNYLIIQLITGAIVYLYLTSTIKWTLLPQLNNSYPKVPPMQKGTDIGWEYIPQTSADLSHIITYGLIWIGFIKISIYSYIKKTAHWVSVFLLAVCLVISIDLLTNIFNGFFHNNVSLYDIMKLHFVLL